MAAATTLIALIALIPMLTSPGSSSDIMVPVAMPDFGGIPGTRVTTLPVPALYCAVKVRQGQHKSC